METQSVIGILSSIPVGTIVSWFIVISGIITSIVMGTIKMYKMFEKTHELKEENIEFRNMVVSHDEQLKVISEKLSTIQSCLDLREKAELKKMRYSIVRAGEEYVSLQKITIRQLKSLEEMFEEYHDKHGNGYVTTLMRKVRALPVIDADDDIDNDKE